MRNLILAGASTLALLAAAPALAQNNDATINRDGADVAPAGVPQSEDPYSQKLSNTATVNQLTSGNTSTVLQPGASNTATVTQ